MKEIRIFLAKLRLIIAAISADNAKKSMNKAIDSTKACENEIDNRYENFLKRAKEQTRAEVECLKLTGGPAGNPIIDVDLGVEHYIVKPDLADKITRYDMETALTRHRYGDWGDITNYSWVINNSHALNRDGEVKSRYSFSNNRHFIVRTNTATGRTDMYLEDAA